MIFKIIFEIKFIRLDEFKRKKIYDFIYVCDNKCDPKNHLHTHKGYHPDKLM